MKIVPKWVAAMGDSCFQTGSSLQFYKEDLCLCAGDSANMLQKEGYVQLPLHTEANYPTSPFYSDEVCPNEGENLMIKDALWMSGIARELGPKYKVLILSV